MKGETEGHWEEIIGKPAKLLQKPYILHGEARQFRIAVNLCL